MIVIVVIWKMKSLSGDVAWHVREFRTFTAASAFTAKQRKRLDVEHVKQIDIS